MKKPVFKLNGRIGQGEPVLQDVDAQHAVKTYRRTAVARFGVAQLDQGS